MDTPISKNRVFIFCLPFPGWILWKYTPKSDGYKS